MNISKQLNKNQVTITTEETVSVEELQSRQKVLQDRVTSLNKHKLDVNAYWEAEIALQQAELDKVNNLLN